MEKCKNCNGTGECYYCLGAKDLNKISPSPVLLNKNKNKEVKCHVCKGTGKCPICGGTGKI